MENYRKSNLWKKSRLLLFSVCRVTDYFPAGEKQRIGRQLQHCCIENLSNIVKWCNQGFDGNRNLLINSMYAMDRLEKCLQHALDLHILNKNDYHYLSQQMAEIRMLITAADMKRQM